MVIGLPKKLIKLKIYWQKIPTVQQRPKAKKKIPQKSRMCVTFDMASFFDKIRLLFFDFVIYFKFFLLLLNQSNSMDWCPLTFGGRASKIYAKCFLDFCCLIYDEFHESIECHCFLFVFYCPLTLQFRFIANRS